MQILDIKSPDQIKNMSISSLYELCNDIRSFLIQSISKTGGHLSSNLGVVELTVALHYVFDSPKDKFIFDVGHQCYTHKILTGRAPHFNTLRKKDGLSGYQKRAESIYDPWEAGHSSTSLSAALGFAIARDINHENYEVIPIIGDGSLTGGMAMEALNDIGSKNKKVIIIFNDNNMSISKNHGGIEQRITSVRSSKIYRSLKHDIKSNLKDKKIGSSLLSAMTNVRDVLKHDIIDAGLFQEFNLDYMGPVDGHNISELIKVLRTAKEHEGPIVVHVLTKKGKGYTFAENDRVGSWHGVSAFDIATGKSLSKLPYNELTWSQVISQTLLYLAKKDEKIVAITPAMAQGSKLLEFAKQFPDRFFDCGIAEQHAITMACGIAAGGLKPFVSVYSSFLQRAYDQVSHDMARMKLPVVIGIDRAGLVGDDGDTHQGIYDIAMLRAIPNLILCQPHDAKEAQNLLYTAFQSKRPFCLRYPRGNVLYERVDEYKEIEIGSWQRFDIGSKPCCIVIAYGNDVDNIIHKAKMNNIDLIVVNARFFKPIDTKMIDELMELDLMIHVYETDCKIAGLCSAILEYLNEKNHKLNSIGIQDHFVEHGSIRTLRIQEHIDTNSLFEEITKDD